MPLKLNTASSGSVTLDAANTASNFTLTVPAQTGSLVTADSSGNVGIGTSSPQAPLNVSYSNDARADTLRLTNRNTGGYGSWLNFYGDYSGGYSFAKIGAENESTGATLRFHTADTSKVSQERMRLDSSGNLQFNSGYGSVATAYGCRAWVNFNGTGTVTIRASGNVSSITDNGTGDYTVNFTTAMPDANYACLGFGEAGGGAGNKGPYQATSSSSGARVFVYNSGGSLVDSALMNIAIFR